MEAELDELVQALRCLPGVGAKSARRMALHLLERDREGARRLSRAVDEAVARIGHCSVCRTLTSAETCSRCADPERDSRVVCVVESPGDVLAIESATDFGGRFHVLLGRLSPLDGIGPEELGLDRLEARLQAEGVEELILATNTSVEGEVTAHYLAEMAARHGIRTTRIAQGIPSGGELEYIDAGTLAHALSGRREY
ncbi:MULTISPECIES: recombination mediator RecR [Thioalkalivibrio]|uniref:Recombination protein RecR n=1 Tax=Thioalkalivibrio versutus TaxID=106634 RepID=A0A0G3G509_9GAMM|nr:MULTISPECIES: recombination mediator RecR [Thioalkalivibrio]AKJ94592.1 recombination protein RecR [Thioalkalivibrio versutus]OOC48006.1 recombination protein RecR [Thioalkalivibrio versutus]